MRSFCRLEHFVVVSSLVILGLFSIKLARASMDNLEPPGDIDFPICQKKVKNDRPELLLVSTLDGKLTALDPTNNGQTLWSVATGPGSMLSSTISQMELTSNGKWVRLIPSLAGGVYKFDGEVIEPVPLTAEKLLRSSFKFAENTVMTGGKESRIYGIEMSTGRIRYECTMEGCFTPSGDKLSPNENDDLEDIIVVKRETQVVRAVEPRTGNEKWNFSVSTHDVTYKPGLEEFCNDTIDEDIDENLIDDLEELKAVVPEGIICKVSRNKPDVVIWKQDFKSPIVHAWKLEKGKLKPINLFSNSHLPRSNTEETIKNDPKLYIGSYQQQLYVQESESQLRQLSDGRILDETTGELVYPKVNWKPYLISADSRTTVINHGSRPQNTELPMLTYDPQSSQKNKVKDPDTALAVIGGNSEYPYDSGLYLYPDEPDLQIDLVEDMKNNATKDDTNESRVEEAEIEEIPNPTELPSQAIQVVFVSMWYWWQEICLISLVTAAVMNILITRPYIQGLREGFRNRLQQITQANRRPNVLVVEVPREVYVEVPVPKTPETASSESNNTVNFSRSTSLYNSNQEFVSRYLTDYEPVQMLGSGGFGVVFESKNKLDENNYAVKRVKLPSNEEAKKKVMREVKCLARLDHRNTVRYYTTWLEYPPHGWQEEADKLLKLNQLTSSNSTQNLSSTRYSFSETTSAGNALNPLKPFEAMPKSSTDLNSLDPSINNDDDNSFRIVFETGGDDDDDDESADNESFHEKSNSFHENSDEESDGGIIFKEESKMALPKPPPSRSISIVSMTQSKFWKEISDDCESENTEAEECLDAMEWDAKNSQKKPPPVYLYIVMQLCQKESLRVWLRNTSESRSRVKSLFMFNEICNGVEYVHSQGLIHRDLKPSNIFFANDGTLKIGDFGLATAGYNGAEEVEMQNQTLVPKDDHEGHTEEVGTELYMSPEQVEKKPYNHKVDIYSLGLILFELLVPFNTQMERIDTLSKLKKLQFSEEFIDQREHELVKSMLAHDPHERPEASEILDMDFLRQVIDDHEASQCYSGPGGDYYYYGSQRRRKHLSSGGSNHSTSQ